MPATIADIAAGTRGVRIESVSDAAIKALYPSARDGSEQPAEGYFDVAADAQSALVARRALLGTERRRFKVVVGALEWPEAELAMPSVLLIDPEQRIESAGMLTRMELSLDSEMTVYEVFC